MLLTPPFSGGAKRRRSRPILDIANPLVRGLNLATIIDEGGLPHDLVGNRFTAARTDASFEDSDLGRAVRGTGSNSHVEFRGLNWAVSKMTVYALLKYVNIGNTAENGFFTQFLNSETGTINAGFNLIFTQATSPKFRFERYAGAYASSLSTTTPTDGSIIGVAGRMDGTNRSAWLGEYGSLLVKEDEDADTGTITGKAGGTGSINQHQRVSLAFYSRNYLFAVFYWADRWLSDDELQSIHANPWQMVDDYSSRIWALGATAAPVTVEPAAATLSFTGQAPAVGLGPLSVAPGPATLSFTGQAPAVALGPATVAPGAATLAFTGYAPTLAETVPVGSAGLTLAGQAPTIALGPLSLTPGAAALDLAGFAPALLTDTRVQPGSATLSLTGLAPAAGLGPLSVAPARAELSLTGLAPGLALAIPVAPAQVTVTGQAPAAALGPLAVAPGISQVVLTGYVATIDTSADKTIAVGVAAVTITGYAPSAALGPLGVAPGPAALQLAGLAPAAGLGPLAIAVEVASIAFSGYAPDIGLGPLVLQPGAAGIDLAGYAPDPRLGPLSISVGGLIITITGQAPTVVAATSAVVDGNTVIVPARLAAAAVPGRDGLAVPARGPVKVYT